MKLCVLCIVLLLACMYPSLAQGSYENCCLMYGKQPKIFKKQIPVSYRMQVTDGGCNINAVIFNFEVRKTKKTLCANPKKPWVQALIKKLKPEYSAPTIKQL